VAAEMVRGNLETASWYGGRLGLQQFRRAIRRRQLTVCPPLPLCSPAALTRARCVTSTPYVVLGGLKLTDRQQVAGQSRRGPPRYEQMASRDRRVLPVQQPTRRWYFREGQQLTCSQRPATRPSPLTRRHWRPVARVEHLCSRHQCGLMRAHATTRSVSSLSLACAAPADADGQGGRRHAADTRGGDPDVLHALGARHGARSVLARAFA
jgi:hypothetical protein